MKIKSIAAVGALGAGLGIASFIGGTGTASAACDQVPTPPLERASCLVTPDLAAFANSIDPFVAADTFLNGNDDTRAGPTDQPKTFSDSLADFREQHRGRRRFPLRTHLVSGFSPTP